WVALRVADGSAAGRSVFAGLDNRAAAAGPRDFRLSPSEVICCLDGRDRLLCGEAGGCGAERKFSARDKGGAQRDTATLDDGSGTPGSRGGCRAHHRAGLYSLAIPRGASPSCGHRQRGFSECVALTTAGEEHRAPINNPAIADRAAGRPTPGPSSAGARPAAAAARRFHGNELQRAVGVDGLARSARRPRDGGDADGEAGGTAGWE